MTSGTIILATNDDTYEGRILWESVVNHKTNKISQIKFTYQLRSLVETEYGGGRTAAFKIETQAAKVSGVSVMTTSATYTTATISIPFGGTWTTIHTDTFTVYHNNYFLQPYVKITTNITSPTSGHNETFTVTGAEIKLTRIIEPATLTTYPTNFTDEDNPVIGYNSPDGNDLDSVEVRIANANLTTIIPYREISKTGSSYTFNFTNAERQILLDTIGNNAAVTVYFQIVSKKGDNSNAGNLKSATLSVINADGPVITATIEDTYAKNLTGGGLKFIRGHNKMAYSMTATGLKGATIKSTSVICGNMKATALSGVLENIENNIVIFSATDSRNRTTTKTFTLEPIDYIMLTCNQSVKMILDGDTSAQVSLKISGNFFNGSFGVQDNYLMLYARFKRNDEEYSEWEDITHLAELNGNSYYVDAIVSGLDPSGTYTFQCAAQDWLTDAVSAEYPVQFIPVFDWSKDDFNFNVPVYIEGNPLNDYVIETGEEPMGTNGTWYWSKWRSGRAECYGCRNYGNMAVSTDWGGWFRSSSFNQDLPFGLFSETPDVIDINLRQGGSGGFIARYEAEAPTSDTTGSFIVVRPRSATISQAHISFNVVGRWI